MDDSFEFDIPDLGEDLYNPIQLEPMAVTDMYFTDSRDQRISELTQEIKSLKEKIHELTAMVQSMHDAQMQQQQLTPIAPRPNMPATYCQFVFTSPPMYNVAPPPTRGCCLPYINWLSGRVSRPPHDVNCPYRLHGYAMS